MRRAAHFVLTSALVTALAACTSAQQETQTLPPPSTANTIPAGGAQRLLHPAQASESIVYSFAGKPDGSGPLYEDLVNVSGMLYGTTASGGAKDNGTVFRTTTSGVESVLFSFKGPPNDGSYPVAGLDKSARYGTTFYGGAYGYGTVFKITETGRKRVLHSFAGGTDGAYPAARLLNVNGTHYGTTEGGDAVSDAGTVFSITTSGTYKVLYKFAGEPDGRYPHAGLISVNGMLYGTTVIGGVHNAGSVFGVTTSGREGVIYSFAGKRDGDSPYACLLYANGALYGTTSEGGSSNNGTVFKVTISGSERVLHRFTGKPDGQAPYSGLINVNGMLYGTTADGGTSDHGTVFSITKSGTENVLYSFAGAPDGALPSSGLLNVNGVLYGTTQQGGASKNGTVFSITPQGS